MINDFDLLLKRCKTRARKKTTYIVLRIFGSIILVGVGILGYFQWNISTQQPIIKTLPKAIITHTVQEENTTIASAVVPAVAKVTIVPVPKTVLPATPIANTPPITNQPLPSSNNRLLEVSNASSTPMSPEQMYQRSPKFETALGIARDFYTKENYAQAAIWAKKANQMNRETEEAWLLYAKSYYAQGKKNEAISVLELFLNYKDSKAASELLKSWK